MLCECAMCVCMSGAYVRGCAMSECVCGGWSCHQGPYSLSQFGKTEVPFLGWESSGKVAFLVKVMESLGIS